MARHKASEGPQSKKQEVFLDRLMRITQTSKPEAQTLAATTSKASYWINPLRGAPAEILDAAESYGIESNPINWLPHAYSLTSDKRALSESDLFNNGQLFIQNLSSMIAVHALDPQKGDHILDICASPGGKAARAASLTNNEFHLWANDSIKPRVQKMQTVFEQFGVNAETVTSHPGQYIDKFVEQKFDRIILDAQCSGEARMDPSKPSTLRYWSEVRITDMSFLQQKMLVSAWKLLKPGGTFVYSTCTYAPEENESPVNFLLRHHEDADVEAIELPLENVQEGMHSWGDTKFDQRLKSAIRLLPSEINEAFFVCRLRKLT